MKCAFPSTVRRTFSNGSHRLPMSAAPLATTLLTLRPKGLQHFVKPLLLKSGLRTILTPAGCRAQISEERMLVNSCARVRAREALVNTFNQYWKCVGLVLYITGHRSGGLRPRTGAGPRCGTEVHTQCSGNAPNMTKIRMTTLRKA